VFAKHPFRPKKSFTKGSPNKQILMYLTQNKTKLVNPKTLVQPWIEPKPRFHLKNKPKQRFKLKKKSKLKINTKSRIFCRKMDQTLKSWRTQRTFIKNRTNTNLNQDKLSCNQGKSFIRNHARIHNLAFIISIIKESTWFCQNGFQLKTKILGLKTP